MGVGGKGFLLTVSCLKFKPQKTEQSQEKSLQITAILLIGSGIDQKREVQRREGSSRE